MHDPRASQAEHHSWNVAGFQKLLEYVAQFQVPKLVVLSSANVYGPQPDNAQFLTEDAPLLGGARFSEIRDLIEVDMLAQGVLLEASRDRDGDPAAGAHPRRACTTRRRTTCACRRSRRCSASIRWCRSIHETDVVRAIALRARARACAASSTSRARIRCRSRTS